MPQEIGPALRTPPWECIMYILGEGTEPDVQKGLTWLQLSAEQDHTGAMRLLSDLYRNGYYGVPQNTEEADRWDQRLREAERRKVEGT